MRCQNCGIEIDTRQESSDGTIVCPGCGTIYRKKAAVKNERKEYKPFNSSDPDSPHSSFWKWQIVAASILVIAIIAAGFFGVNRLLSDARKRRDLLTEPSHGYAGACRFSDSYSHPDTSAYTYSYPDACSYTDPYPDADTFPNLCSSDKLYLSNCNAV